jgi:hypothetical protein
MEKINNMEKTIEKKQITPEELKNIKDLQTKYNSLVFELGSIEAQFQSAKIEVLAALRKLGDDEKELVKVLHEKYGTGNINIEDGTLIPV